MSLKSLFLLFCTAILLQVSAQNTFPTNGVNNPENTYWAFTNANIYVQYDQFIKNGTLLIRNGLVKKVGKGIQIPAEAVVIDLKGKYIYPSFIDLHSNYGMPEVKKIKSSGISVQLQSSTKIAGNWNEQIHPETRASDLFTIDQKRATTMRGIGFGTVMTHRMDGIMRGTSSLVFLGEKNPNTVMFESQTAQQLAFNRGQSRQVYPTSLMGMIALIRQTYYDAIWYENKDVEQETNFSLQSLIDTKDLPIVIEVRDARSIPRAIKIAREFDRNLIVKGPTDSYLEISALSDSKVPLILPVNFPEHYDVSAAFDELNVSLEQLKEWELAPAAARILSDSGINFCITTSGLKQPIKFIEALRKIRSYNISEAKIIKALTYAPASMINQEKHLGGLTNDKIANFFISTGNIFNKNATIVENWVKGERFVVKREELDIRGKYNLNVNKETFQLDVEGERMSPKAKLAYKNKKLNVDIQLQSRSIELSFVIPGKKGDISYRLSGVVNDDESRIWVGKAVVSQGEWVDWAAIRQTDAKNTNADTTSKNLSLIPPIWYPNRSFGFDTLPTSEIVIFQNATIWTNEDTGILENSDIAIADGKILAIGNNLTRVGLFGEKDVNVKLIDAKGKHVTCGIIDEHSHIAIDRGVNEAGWNSSAEVSIGDVIRANDINIYRQLMGGVTASQLLHGSANPIGGKSALIKLRWGRPAEEMKIEKADGFIKFALGENVKQSNWGDNRKTRFPQTRMGVEQVYYDAFSRASAYREIWEIHNRAVENKRRKDVIIAPRRDLRLEALSEILDTVRFITCHSYVQSEINMLMHVADSMKFKVNTFTHVLEGYKVVDKLRKHGAGASTFSDWWAYKFEVNDAIPYNASILNEQGVVTALNSDNAEMGRRLNQEAAKSVKYGGTSMEDAWKMVTLNPAKLLHLDDRMGSLKVGKDADIVLWSGNPLSVNSKVLKTYVDGICYFDRERHEELKKRDSAERHRIINKMIAEAKKNKKKGKKPTAKEDKLDHCDSIEFD